MPTTKEYAQVITIHQAASFFCFGVFIVLVLAALIVVFVIFIPVIQVKKIGSAKIAIQYQAVTSPNTTTAIIKLYRIIRVSIPKLNNSILMAYNVSLSINYNSKIQRWKGREDDKGQCRK